MDLIYQFWMVVVEELGILYARSVLVKIKLDFKVYLTLVMNVFKSTDSSTDDKQLLIRRFTLFQTVLVILTPDWFNTKQITVKIFGLENCHYYEMLR